MGALSVGLSGRFMLCTVPIAAGRVRDSNAAYSIPRSPWKIQPSRGRRLISARLSAYTVSMASVSRPRPPANDAPRVAFHNHAS
jgi:hypothetical protein